MSFRGREARTDYLPRVSQHTGTREISLLKSLRRNTVMDEHTNVYTSIRSCNRVSWSQWYTFSEKLNSFSVFASFGNFWSNGAVPSYPSHTLSLFPYAWTLTLWMKSLPLRQVTDQGVGALIFALAIGVVARSYLRSVVPLPYTVQVLVVS